MKLINVSQEPIYLDDINIVIPYTSDKRITEIADSSSRRSRALAVMLHTGRIIDVTKGIPDPLPEFKPKVIQPDPESPYFSKQAMLSRDDHGPKQPETISTVSPFAAKQRIAYEKLPSAVALFESGTVSAAWTGPACDAGGYARMNRKFMFGLSSTGCSIRYDKLDSINDMDRETTAGLSKLCSTRIPEDAIKVYGMTAPLHYDWERYKMLFTMMETRRLHPDYVIRCNCADEIVVPSRWCAEIFKESGVKRQISVVPLGVDTEIYHRSPALPGVNPPGYKPPWSATIHV